MTRRLVFWRLALWALILATSFGRDAHALGIAMRFVDITLEKVEPGTFVNLRLSRNLPLVVINQEDTPVDIVIESVSPKAEEMKDGYEPSPDPTWVRAVPNRFHLGPKASASSDILIAIPNDPNLIGKHYEIIVWVHTEQKNKALSGGVHVEAGLRSRFRLSIGTIGPAALQREKALKKLATINVNFSLSPDNLYAQDVELGKPVDLKAQKRASLKIINQSDDPVELKVSSVPQDPNVVPQSGYEYSPDPSWISLSPAQIKVPGNSIKEILLKANIPNRPENKGKKFMFLIQTTLSDDSLPLLYHNMVYLTTAL